MSETSGENVRECPVPLNPRPWQSLPNGLYWSQVGTPCPALSRTPSTPAGFFAFQNGKAAAGLGCPKWDGSNVGCSHIWRWAMVEFSEASLEASGKPAPLQAPETLGSISMSGAKWAFSTYLNGSRNLDIFQQFSTSENGKAPCQDDSQHGAGQQLPFRTADGLAACQECPRSGHPAWIAQRATA